MKKKYKYLFVLILIFFVSLQNVTAKQTIKFSVNKNINGGNSFFNYSLKYSKKNPGFPNGEYLSNSKYWNFIKKYTIKEPGKSDKTGYAYCANKKRYFASSGYSPDTTYRSLNNCTYKYKQNEVVKEKTGGDCSEIIGYIIKESLNDKYDGDSNFNKYNNGQAAVWVYLGVFTKEGSYLRNDNPYKHLKYAYDNNADIRNIIINAGTKYYEANHDITTGTELKKTQQTNDIFDVEDNDLNFYYEPKDMTCGSEGGIYKTKPIKIKNKTNKTITVNITAENVGFDMEFHDHNNEIIEGNVDVGENTFTISSIPNKNYITVTLSTAKYLTDDEIGDGNAKISISSQLTEKNTQETTKSKKVPDSKRYKNPGDQAIIIYSAKNEEDTVTTTTRTTLNQEKSYVFKQDKLIFKQPTEDNEDNKSGKCANITTNINEIEKKLSGSSCQTIELENDGSVRIIVSETVKFSYGYLFPQKYNNGKPMAYSGGGFNLNTDINKGATTNYNAAISWQFADYNETQNQPYYYIPNQSKPNNNNYDISKVIDKINQELLKSVSNKYQNHLNLSINTYDSNELNSDGTGKKYNYEMNIYQTAQNKSKINELQFIRDNSIKDKIVYKLNLEIKNIELKNYKRIDDTNGMFEYCNKSKEECSSDGFVNSGYFVPMYFKDGDFKFNINDNNISIVDGITLKYTGNCSIDIENRFNGGSLRYRSITVNNPFPKANKNTYEGVPSNWKEWYKNTQNQNRIAQTFTKPSIYSLKITNEKLEKIEKYNNESLYTSWKNISQEGRSSLIQEIFNTKANNNSYCKLGEFKESCDK